MRIYLAGPGVFYPDPLKESNRLKQICLTHGLEGVFPLDTGLDVSAMSKHEAAHAIYQANIKLIHSCQGVMADMQAFRGPGMDGGTAFEMGYAKALGLRIIGYGNRGDYFTRVRNYYTLLTKKPCAEVDPNGLSIEDFDLPDNLMMARAADHVVSSPQEAAAWFQKNFKN